MQMQDAVGGKRPTNRRARKLTYAFSICIMNVELGFPPGIQTEHQEFWRSSSFFWPGGKECIRQLSLTCRALSLQLAILSFRALIEA